MELTIQDLMTLETYNLNRTAFKKKAMNRKQQLRIHVGEYATFLFEDALTIQYQIQEMLRIERIFEHELIQEELDVYNPLISNQYNLKATLLFEHPSEIRKEALKSLKGIEHHIDLTVDGTSQGKVIANEDLERSNAEKTSAVHFVRFEITEAVRQALQNPKSEVSLRFKHPAYSKSTLLSPEQKNNLLSLTQ